MLQTGDLLIEEIISLVDQADQNFRDDLRWASLNEATELLECNSSLGPKLAKVTGFLRVFVPNICLSASKKIVVIQAYFAGGGSSACAFGSTD